MNFKSLESLLKLSKLRQSSDFVLADGEPFPLMVPADQMIFILETRRESIEALKKCYFALKNTREMAITASPEYASPLESIVKKTLEKADGDFNCKGCSATINMSNALKCLACGDPI